MGEMNGLTPQQKYLATHKRPYNLHGRKRPGLVFRASEIACCESEKLRFHRRVDQTPRQIMTIWHIV